MDEKFINKQKKINVKRKIIQRGNILITEQICKMVEIPKEGKIVKARKREDSKKNLK